MSRRLIYGFLVLSFGLPGQPGLAATGDWVGDKRVSARLSSDPELVTLLKRTWTLLRYR